MDQYEVVVDEGGHERLGGVWDDREDPEVLRRARRAPSGQGRSASLRSSLERKDARVAVLGYLIQPAIWGERDA